MGSSEAMEVLKVARISKLPADQRAPPHYDSGEGGSMDSRSYLGMTRAHAQSNYSTPAANRDGHKTS
jgi:hypothetical protein